eukprot:CAMPEP_0117083522 /NCGR_PEP_ID=MMETSP0472-20121206/58807_1 /TAXON_ID=693140 ORGANISM="Tiarina fusus, Strain LIS" /NCGR_SAMPLE_ID=MMETSP0472 /ASSEMBLY_ACC=CAM_ASM_000603 /LENGTH=561 /DNA_ID=CAMNT_0004812185 /DNA_START=260 /DNA_END=1945 /DNA_ORIENTATION=-
MTSSTASSTPSSSSSNRRRSRSIHPLFLLGVCLIISSSSPGDAFVLDNNNNAVGRSLTRPTTRLYSSNGLNNNDASINGPSGPGSSRYVNSNNGHNSNNRRYMARNSNSDMWQESTTSETPAASSSRRRTSSSSSYQDNSFHHNHNPNGRRPATYEDRQRESLIRSNDLIRSVSPMQNNYQPYRQPSQSSAAPDTPWERRTDSPSYETARRSPYPNNGNTSTSNNGNYRESVRRPAQQQQPQQHQPHFPRPSSPSSYQQHHPEQSLVRTPRRRSSRRVMDPFRRDDFHNNISNNGNYRDGDDFHNNYYDNGGRRAAQPPPHEDPAPPSPLHPLEVEVQQLRKQLQAKGTEHEKLLETLLEVNDNLERALRMASAAAADAAANAAATVAATSSSSAASTTSSAMASLYSSSPAFEEEDTDDTTSSTTTTTTSSSNNNANALQTLCDGIQLTQNTLDKALEQGKLEKYGKEGDEFDPKYHSALFDFSDPTRTPGTIGHVIKDGYLIKNGNKNTITNNNGVNGNGSVNGGDTGVNGHGTNGDNDGATSDDRVLRYAEVSVVKEE